MIRAVTTTEDRPRVAPPLLFMVAEFVLVASVPFIGWQGFDALLDSRAGTFVEGPTPTDPGWEAFVDPSPVSLVVEVDRGVVTGAVLVAQPEAERAGGAVVLIPGDLLIAGVGLSEMLPAQVGSALADELDLAIGATFVADEAGWSETLAGGTWTIRNPDPVPADDGSVLIEVGSVDLVFDDVAPFVGRPAEGAVFESLMVRRELWWSALVESPPAADEPLAVLIAAVADGPFVIDVIPTEVGPSGRLLDLDATGELIAEIVPFPAGAEPGDRIQVRVLARSLDVDLEDEARALGQAGFEIIGIGNGPVFDEGATTVIVPIGFDDDRIDDLVAQVGADTVRVDESDVDSEIVTVLIGR